MGKELDLEDEQFETLLADKRHRELTVALKNIATNLANKDDSGIVEAIKEQVVKMEELVSVIQSHNPEVNVELNPKEFVTSVQKIGEDIIASNNKVIEALENRLLPDTFDMVRAYGNSPVQSVKVNYKQANKITLKK